MRSNKTAPTLDRPLGASSPYDDDEVGLALIESALDILADGGHGEFSLRRVAERVGASASAASHRFGDRAGLVSAVCDAALARERRELHLFASQLPALPATADPLARVLHEWMDQRTRWGRRQARAICELLLMAYRDPAAGSFGAAYLACYRAFVAELSPGLGPQVVDRLALYLIAAGPNWLVLADDTTFRLQCGETVRRMVEPQGAPLFWLEQSLLREHAAPPSPVSTPNTTKGKIAQAVAAIIARDGARAVTHRAISGLASVSLSSLIHHFGNRLELVRVGIQEWVAGQAAARTIPGSTFLDQPLGRELAIAPYEVALQALSDPMLAPLTAALRRRQGALPQRPIQPGGVSAAHGEMEASSLLATALVLTSGAQATGLAERLEQLIEA